MNQINGDNPRNFLNRLLYFYQCLSDHRKGINKSFKNYKPTLSIKNLITFKKTPTRILCDGFWNSLDYKNIKLQLNSNLNFFDVGCGSGLYGNFLQKLSGEYFSSYTGLDIYKNHDYPSKFNHIISKAEEINKYIDKDTNFVISQSALEHIEKDDFVIEEITRKLLENKKPFIQIHMIPANKCLWLYLWHGYRQYSKKNLVTKIDQLKKNFNIKTSITPIGGNISFWTHIRYITIPIYFKKFILRDKFFKWYDQKNVEKKIIKSVNRELQCDQENPLFWAFVISSNDINIEDSIIKKFSI